MKSDCEVPKVALIDETTRLPKKIRAFQLVECYSIRKVEFANDGWALAMTSSGAKIRRRMHDFTSDRTFRIPSGEPSTTGDEVTKPTNLDTAAVPRTADYKIMINKQVDG
jgi:hypothetical protein